MKRQDKLNFSPTFSQLLDFLCLSLKFLLYYGCKRTHNAQLCSMPAMFKANERYYNRTFGLYGLETLNHRSELKILWDTFRSQIAELSFPYDRRMVNDRRRSQAIAEVCFHMIADDRRTFCDLRSSAIIWKPALSVCLLKILFNGWFLGKHLSMTSRYFLPRLVLTLLSHGGLYQVIFLFRALK